jgi:riboflavin kinase/FMN adenylyltransferase
LLIEFNRAFSEQTGETFIRGLARDLGSVGARACDAQPVRNHEAAAGHRPALQSICVGADFVFGHKRSGNVASLRQLGAELNFTVHGLAAVALDGEVVSSTRIRSVIQAGELDAASQMLGRPYSLSGTVLTGDQLGRRLGFPTANLDVARLVLPPNGVYAARTTVSGMRHRSVLNLGLRPTVQTGALERRCEVHVLDFAGYLYDQEVEVEFVAKLRDEVKFASLDELKAQIAADIKAAERCF